MKTLIENKYNEVKDYFYKKELVKYNKKFTLYSYHIMSPHIVDSIACEFRGLLIADDGTIIPSINKFFNYKENQEIEKYHSQFDEIEVYDKMDGSLITAFFIENVLFVKSKNSFDTPQANMAYEYIIENKNYFYFIYECYRIGLYPQFELISPDNRIVVLYNETKLVLLALRYVDNDTKTIKYMDYNDMVDMAEAFHIEYVNAHNYTLDDLLHMKKTQENVEGWVIKSKSDLPPFAQFAKIKTDWYLERHRLYNLSLSDMIKLILDEKIDDIMEIIPNKKYVEDVMDKLSRIYEKYYKDVMEILNDFRNGMSMKDIAQKYRFIENSKNKQNPAFVIFTKLRKMHIDDAIKEYILFNTRKEKMAKEFLERI